MELIKTYTEQTYRIAQNLFTRTENTETREVAWYDQHGIIETINPDSEHHPGSRFLKLETDWERLQAKVHDIKEPRGGNQAPQKQVG